jgi:hypothetical protein
VQQRHFDGAGGIGCLCMDTWRRTSHMLTRVRGGGAVLSRVQERTARRVEAKSAPADCDRLCASCSNRDVAG